MGLDDRVRPPRDRRESLTSRVGSVSSVSISDITRAATSRRPYLVSGAEGKREGIGGGPAARVGGGRRWTVTAFQGVAGGFVVGGFSLLDGGFDNMVLSSNILGREGMRRR